MRTYASFLYKDNKIF